MSRGKFKRQFEASKMKYKGENECLLKNYLLI